MKFRMVDRIVAWQAKESIQGTKSVSFEEYHLKGPFGGQPHLPESLLMESLFQLGNWLIMLSTDFQHMGLLVRLQQVRFDAELRPGQHVHMEIQVRSYRDDGILFDGQAHCRKKRIAAGVGCLATPVSLDQYQNPDDLRVLFSEIYRPKG